MPPAISAEVPTSSRLCCGGELEAAPLEEVLLGAGPDRLGVEQQAVVVEDDGGGQGRLHRREHMVVACPSTSSSAAASTTPASFNLSREQLMAEVIEPWLEDRPVELGEQEWVPAESKLTILEGPHLDGPGPRLRPGLVQRRAGEPRT